jgi:hypothetical protein
MTAEMTNDNPEEIPCEDNSEEIVDEVDDVDGDAAHLSEQQEDQSDDFWHGNPEELPEDLKPAYKSMQRAFTKRMQKASDLEKKYFESIDAANAAVLARAKDFQSNAQPEATQEEPAPDLAAGAKPEDVIEYYVKQAVGEAMQSAGVEKLSREMQPVAQRERVVSAYRTFAGDNPKLDHQKLAPLTGQIIDSDPELAELAVNNPASAIRLAARIASAELSTQANKQKSRNKRQAAPVSARSGTVVRRKKETMLDAATRALKEAGVNPDLF